MYYNHLVSVENTYIYIICISVCVYVCIYMHMYVYVYIYMQIYISHTYTPVYILLKKNYLLDSKLFLQNSKGIALMCSIIC